MKYKLRPENTEIERANATNKLLVFFGKNLDIRTENAMPDIIARGSMYGICFFVNILPSLLANVSILIKRVLLNIINNKGVPRNVIIYINAATSVIRKFVLIKCATASPPDIANQNTKFQSLSLLSHLSCLVWVKGLILSTNCFVKSCIIRLCYYVNSHYHIIPTIYLITKQIIITLTTIILVVLPNTTHAATKAEVLRLIKSAEKEYNIPSGLLLAVAKTESNLEVYALNIRGRPIFPTDRDAALKMIRQALDSGISNIDIGVTQLNYKWHHHNFSSLEAMLSPETNIKYAARLLLKLKQKHANWHTALRHYHSSKPEYHRKYSRRVVMCWLGV
jgi:hypothetical protein